LHHASHLYGSVGNAVNLALRHHGNATYRGNKICCKSFYHKEENYLLKYIKKAQEPMLLRFLMNFMVYITLSVG
jgi:hypothetical protein